MQRYSFADSSIPGLHVHPAIKADKIKGQLLNRLEDVPESIRLLQKISRILLDQTKDYFAINNYVFSDIIPILIMRGGMIMKSPVEAAFPTRPLGVVVLHRTSPSSTPKVVYANVPVSSNTGSLYLLFDVLIATGSTMLASLQSIFKHTKIEAGTNAQVILVSPFTSEMGIRVILNHFPTVAIHTIWHQEKVDINGRMVGPGFDIGDYAMGGSTIPRVKWNQE